MGRRDRFGTLSAGQSSARRCTQPQGCTEWGTRTSAVVAVVPRLRARLSRVPQGALRHCKAARVFEGRTGALGMLGASETFPLSSGSGAGPTAKLVSPPVLR